VRQSQGNQISTCDNFSRYDPQQRYSAAHPRHAEYIRLSGEPEHLVLRRIQAFAERLIHREPPLPGGVIVHCKRRVCAQREASSGMDQTGSHRLVANARPNACYSIMLLRATMRSTGSTELGIPVCAAHAFSPVLKASHSGHTQAPQTTYTYSTFHPRTNSYRTRPQHRLC
jgi:hypothetical protein